MGGEWVDDAVGVVSLHSNQFSMSCSPQVLWTHHLSSDYALFIALAILDQEKEKLMNESFDFSDVIAVSK